VCGIGLEWIMWMYARDGFSGCYLMVGSYEHSNIGLGCIRGGGFLDNPQDYQPWRITLLNCVIIID
jgi:hypothetical protein